MLITSQRRFSLLSLAAKRYTPIFSRFTQAEKRVKSSFNHANCSNSGALDKLHPHQRKMSQGDVTTPDDFENEHESSYKPPPEKTIEEILQADQDDESLRKYKEALLGQAQTGPIIVEPDNPKKVIVKRLVLVVADRPELALDLTSDLSKLKKETFVIKEGVSYKIRIEFIVQREIVHGLKYVQKTSKLGLPVDKMTHMVGSYAPKDEMQSYTTPAEDAPTGMLARGSYTVHSLFTDDDKNEHLKWEWTFEIKKDWKD